MVRGIDRIVQRAAARGNSDDDWMKFTVLMDGHIEKIIRVLLTAKDAVKAKDPTDSLNELAVLIHSLEKGITF